VTLGSIVVTASGYSALGGGPERRDFLTRQELNRTAHLGDDLFRALGQLPGATPTDFSAGFGVRGGVPGETLVVLDGLEIADPFHIKYFQNAISIIDSDAIGSLDYLSGGFPVEYGGAMSAVIDMSTKTPDEERHTYAGISFTHARVVSDGTFADDRGRWLVSLRRGYFDILFDLFYKDITARPRYTDLIGKVEYRLGDRSLLSTNVLAAVDSIHYDADGDSIDGSYNNVFAWGNLRTAWTPHTSSQTVASYSRLRQRKSGTLDTRDELGVVRDDREFDIIGLKQDWTLDRSQSGHLAKFGVDLKHFSTSYDYTSQASTNNTLLRFTGLPVVRTRDVAIAPRGNSIAVYAADRVRLASRLAIEGGVRFESESWRSGSGVSPRVNLVYTPTEHTAVRASWGEFRQAQRLDDLSVEDGDVSANPAQRSKQIEIGVEHHFGFGVLARGTAYRKTTTHVRPRYENLFDRDEFFPEVKYDRIRLQPESARATGVELMLKDESGRPFSWWVSVVRSRVTDRFANEEAPRSWDQPLAFGFNTNYQPRSHWNFNLGGFYHTGWPTTELRAAYDPTQTPFPLTITLGPRNRQRLPAYQRLDARVMRSASFSRGTFRSWLEVTNVFNRENPCCIAGFTFNIDGSRRTVDITPNHNGLGWLPSFGVAWEF
jgi:outer membrane receptor protein involved in Fe transport